ncbi:MAG: hypothetical protein GY832_24220 [Chloroflexi bacterium]|nr:hypothetical protein [Chloroflexota bacterium]
MTTSGEVSAVDGLALLCDWRFVGRHQWPIVGQALTAGCWGAGKDRWGAVSVATGGEVAAAAGLALLR